MGRLDALRRTEQQVEQAAKRGLHNLEANVRRRLRFSQTSQASPFEEEEPNAPNACERTGIVSVNGQDVERMHCTGGRNSA